MNIRLILTMMVSGIEDTNKGLAFRFIRPTSFFKALSIKILKKGSGRILIKMAANIRENFYAINFMGKENISAPMENTMKVILKRV